MGRHTDQQAAEALRSVGLGDRMDHHELNLRVVSDSACCGQGSVNRPSIILADEPTGNLDSKTSYEIMDLFDNQTGRATRLSS
ncbi:MAG: hypothetical protein R2787_12860 [Saprospiraceae bacterium]